jgi:hypothetical protein
MALMKGTRNRMKNLDQAAKADPKLMVYQRKDKLTGQVIETQNWNGTGSSPNVHLVRTSDETHPGPPWRSGGPFLSLKCYFPNREVQGIGSWRAEVGNEIRTITGGFSHPVTCSHIPDGAAFSNYGWMPGMDASVFPNLSPWGSKAYAKLRPQLEKAGLAVFLSELRDLPRMLKTTSKFFHETWRDLGGATRTTRSNPWVMQPKKVADHFLNHQFGWVPFVNDLVKLQDAFVNSQKYIDQITKDNNQWVRRTRTMASTEESTKLCTNSGLGCEPIKFEMSDFMDFGGGGHWDVHKEETSIVWASGSFKYYRPEFDLSLPSYDSAMSDLQRNLTLYGLRINPSNVYKATPWTWLVDWFSNVGDHVDHINDIGQDGVASKYMYVMQTKVTHYRSYHYVPWFQGRRVMSWDRFVETKQRQPASSSFGFDLAPDALSLRQIAILGALGLTRKPS